jgi:hypothetical protein
MPPPPGRSAVRHLHFASRMPRVTVTSSAPLPVTGAPLVVSYPSKTDTFKVHRPPPSLLPDRPSPRRFGPIKCVASIASTPSFHSPLQFRNSSLRSTATTSSAHCLHPFPSPAQIPPPCRFFLPPVSTPWSPLSPREVAVSFRGRSSSRERTPASVLCAPPLVYRGLAPYHRGLAPYPVQRDMDRVHRLFNTKNNLTSSKSCESCNPPAIFSIPVLDFK